MLLNQKIFNLLMIVPKKISKIMDREVSYNRMPNLTLIKILLYT